MQSDTTGSLQEFHKILEEARKRSFRYPLCAERAAAAPDRWKACGYDRGMERVFSMEELIEKLLDKNSRKHSKKMERLNFPARFSISVSA